MDGFLRKCLQLPLLPSPPLLLLWLGDHRNIGDRLAIGHEDELPALPPEAVDAHVETAGSGFAERLAVRNVVAHGSLLFWFRTPERILSDVLPITMISEPF